MGHAPTGLLTNLLHMKQSIHRPGPEQMVMHPLACCPMGRRMAGLPCSCNKPLGVGRHVPTLGIFSRLETTSGWMSTLASGCVAVSVFH